MTEAQRKVLLKSQQGELDAVIMYQLLTKKMKNPKFAAVLNQLAAEEGRHAAVFRSLTGENLSPKNTKGKVIALLQKIVGWKLLFRIMAKGEYGAAKTYAPMIKDFPEIESVLKDENRHGDILMDLSDSFVK
ncbi:ferritin family protein [Cellulosilyticum ruminicola]|uniref:ferritin family protein n=1 Tax=Cellulosilyticum ruminicola TaxID=425254 RepID=UPI0006CFE353|nr:ferritin family protein [Cellulosilyticum ruminicola]